MKLNLQDFDFHLPESKIAHFPPTNRSDSKLLQVTPEGNFNDLTFTDIVSLIPENAVLVRNNTRVIPARCMARKVTGARVEVFLERMISEQEFLAYSRASKSPKLGTLLVVGEDKIGQSTLSEAQFAEIEKLAKQYLASPQSETQSLARIHEILTSTKQETILLVCSGRDDTLFKYILLNNLPLTKALEKVGHIPIPPYMEREDQESDAERYQTVYAKVPGAVAAPTAGLHFTEEIVEQLKQKNVEIIEVTLHVGAGTFIPVKTDNIYQHHMHSEWIDVDQATADQLNQALSSKRPLVAVGTTSVRTLETLAQFSLRTKLEQDFAQAGADKNKAVQVQQELTARTLLQHFFYKLDEEQLDLLLSSGQDLATNQESSKKEILEFLNSRSYFKELEFNQANLTLIEQSKDFLVSLAQDFIANSNEKLNNELTKQPEVINNFAKEVIRLSQVLEQQPHFSSVYLNTEVEFGKEVPILPYQGYTEIFIHPGKKAHLVDLLITNFHLPKSTLIMLVSAFIGRELCLAAYQHAISQDYRFYSYGDACFIPNLLKQDKFSLFTW